MRPHVVVRLKSTGLILGTFRDFREADAWHDDWCDSIDDYEDGGYEVSFNWE